MQGRADAYDAWVRARALNAEQQLKILAMIWDKPVGDDVGYVFLPWIPGWAKDKDERRRNWNEGRGFKWPQEREAILAHLKTHTKDDLYFTPNTFLGESRVAQFTGEETALYADLDEVDPTADIDSALQPTIAWETSPGRFQGIWLLDNFADGATEAGGLNHRLTAALGADPSGWDTTQLLRVPGRRNFKFNYKDEEGDSPPGRLLWVRDKRFSVEWLDARLPEVTVYGTGAEVEDHEVDSTDPAEVYARVRLKLSKTVRDYMALRSRNITEDHDRSEVMWQIERDLADAGCSIAEIVAIIRASVWNKHAGRNNEMAQLKAEAAKAIGVSEADSQETVFESAEAEVGAGFDQLPSWDDFFTAPIKKPRWLVRNIWAEGSVGFISGAPKSYKSYFGLDLAISVSTGRPFLNDPQFSVGKARPVIVIQEEDSAALVRLRAEQVVEGKVPEAYYKGEMYMEGSDVVWRGPTHQGLIHWAIRRGFLVSSTAWQMRLADLIDETGAGLVLIDTLGTTLGDVELNDSVKMNERVLKPLKQISELSGCAIAIVHHNKKSSEAGGRLGQQMLGSVAVHAWVESALYVQSKEKVTGQPTEVKVERENKLAEDLKFRVRIPFMWEEKGGAEEGDRQLWEPDVWLGWSETNDEQAAMAEVVPRTTGKNLPGQVMADVVMEMGEGWHEYSDIVTAAGRNPGTVTKQLANAVRSGLLRRDDNNRYRIIG